MSRSRKSQGKSRPPPAAQPTPAPSNPLKTLPQREVTPDMRARTARTFWLILLGFFVGIGMLVAALAWQGRVARDYARGVRETVLAGKPSPNASYSVGCDRVKPGGLPRGITACEVQVVAGQVGVHLMFEGGREYILKR